MHPSHVQYKGHELNIPNQCQYTKMIENRHHVLILGT